MKIRFLFLLVLLQFSMMSCGGRGSTESKEGEVKENPSIVPATPSKATVKIYFENTLSMDGYINGNTGFKDVLRDLLIAVDNENDLELKTEFYLVNNKLTPTDFGVAHTKIAEKLTPTTTSSKGNKGSSNFEEILNTVLQNQEGDVISVVMADFIYSPQGVQDTPSALNKLRTYTQDAFLKATKANESMDTRVYRFQSDFKGVYFDIENKGIQGINTRPYYLIVTAPTELMTVFTHKIATQLQRTDGFQNEALFSTTTIEEVSTHVLTATGNKGRIQMRRGELEVLRYPNNENLEFVVLLDLTDLPLDEEYILDNNNYGVDIPKFTVKEVGAVRGNNIEFVQQESMKMDPTTLVNIQGQKFTHALLFEADGLVSEDLTFSLKKSIPPWVKAAHSENDKDIRDDSLEQTKTFGFGHLVEGISRAYELQSGNDEYFSVTIPLKNN